MTISDRASLLVPAFVSLFFAINPNVALAKCSALPVLSEIVDYVPELQGQTSRDATSRIGYKIEALRQQLSRASMTASLAEYGMERRIADLLDFKVKTGALTRIAIEKGPANLKPYLTGSGYQRSFLTVKEIVEQICDTDGGTDPSAAATRQISQRGSGTLAALSALVAPAVAASGLLLVAGLFFGTKLRNARLAKDARVNKRTACDIPVQIDGQSGFYHLNVVDISRAGVNLANHPKTQTGDVLTVDFGPLTREAKVRWSNDHFAGLQFTRPMSARQLSKLLAEQCKLSAYEKKKRGTQKGAAPESLTA